MQEVHPVEQFAHVFVESRKVPLEHTIGVKQLYVAGDQTAGRTQFEVHPEEDGLKPSAHELQLTESAHERQLLLQDWQLIDDWLK